MYQRKDRWYSDIWYEGKRYTKGWGAISKTVAKEKERKLLNEVASGKYESKRNNILFEKLVEQYLEYSQVHKRPRSHRRDIELTNSLLTHFKGKSLIEIHPFLIERYKKERLEKVKPATVNRELACLKVMFNVAIKWKIARENPVREVKLFKEERIDVTVLTPEKEIELLEALDRDRKAEHSKAIVISALNTGMRKREILDLTKDNVDFKNRIIHVTHTKNWEVRDIPMNEVLTSILKEVIKKVPKITLTFLQVTELENHTLTSRLASLLQ